MLTRALFTGLALCAGFLLSGCTSCCHHRPAAAPGPAFVGSAPIASPGCATCAPGGAGPAPLVPAAPTPVAPSFYPPGTYAPRY